MGLYFSVKTGGLLLRLFDVAIRPLQLPDSFIKLLAKPVDLRKILISDGVFHGNTVVQKISCP